MTKEQRLDVEATLVKAFDSFTDERLKGTYYPLTGMSMSKRKELINAHYLFTDDDECLQIIGTYNDWPAGRGIFINDRKEEFGTFIVWVGEEDHMRIMAMDKGSDCIAVWRLFYNGLQAVHEGVRAQGHDFAFSESHGYLNTCVTNIGTGMRASVHVNLANFPTKQSVKDYVKQKDMMIDIRGTHGESKNTDGVTIYDVSNKARLGSDCFEQLQTMVDGVGELLQVSRLRGLNANQQAVYGVFKGQFNEENVALTLAEFFDFEGAAQTVAVVDEKKPAAEEPDFGGAEITTGPVTENEQAEN